jgi:hypothetical protein
MNKNQMVVHDALYNEVRKGNITHTHFRKLLDVCLAALEEPTQASESKQVDLKDLQFYFDNAYGHEIAKFGHNLIYYVNTGILKAKKKDKRLFGMHPSIIAFDEMHTYIQPGGVFDKFKNLVQVKKNKKDEAVNVPVDAIVKPNKFEVLTNEDMKNILMSSGYAVIESEEFSENYIDVRTLRNQTAYEKWLFKKANEFRRNVLDMLQELYKNERITFEEYADNVASVDSWRIAMNSKQTKEQLDEMYKHKTNVFSKEPTVQGEIEYKRADGHLFIREAEEKDELAEIDKRLNEIADKINGIFPLVKRIDTDTLIIKSGLGLKGVRPGENKPNVKMYLDDYPLTKRQLKQVADYVNVNLKINSDTNINDLVKQLKDEIAKDLKETRLKGKLY